jgi:hypothetical protein
VAACIGLGISAFEHDLAGREFGWRQLASVVALLFVVVGLLPVIVSAGGGRWDMPSSGAEEPLAFLSHPTEAVSRVLWLGDPRALPVGGWSIEPGLAYALTAQSLPDTEQVLTPAGPGPASQVADAVRLAVDGGTVHLGRLLAPAGVRYVVVVEGLAPSTVGVLPASVSAPPPAALEQDLLAQDDLQVVPGELGVQVYENGEDMPVTAQRGTPLPPGHAGTYPSAADVTGWQPSLSAMSGGTPANGEVPAGTVYAGYAPSGRFPLTVDGRTAQQRPAFAWAAQYQTLAGHATLAYSAFPYVPLVALLELVAWVFLAVAFAGLPQRRSAPSHAAAAHHAVAHAAGHDAAAPVPVVHQP